MSTPAQNDTTSRRVIRGGSWSSFVPSWVRAASRDTDDPAVRSNDIGFRVRCAMRGRQPLKVTP